MFVLLELFGTSLINSYLHIFNNGFNLVSSFPWSNRVEMLEQCRRRKLYLKALGRKRVGFRLKEWVWKMIRWPKWDIGIFNFSTQSLSDYLLHVFFLKWEQFIVKCLAISTVYVDSLYFPMLYYCDFDYTLWHFPWNFYLSLQIFKCCIFSRNLK